MQAKYRKLVRQWMATGKVEEETHHGEAEITSADLKAEACGWIEFKYANDAGRRSCLLLICTILEDDARSDGDPVPNHRDKDVTLSP